MAARFSDQEVLEATAARQLRAGASSGYERISTDTRTLSPVPLCAAPRGERSDPPQSLAEPPAKAAAGAGANRGKPLPQTPPSLAPFEEKDTLAPRGALGRFHRLRFQIPLAAVTGSN